MSSQFEPLFFGECRPLPIVGTRFVLWKHLDPKLFFGGAFLGGDMGLKFDRGGSRFGNGVNVAMGHAQASFMSQAHFCNRGDLILY